MRRFVEIISLFLIAAFIGKAEGCEFKYTQFGQELVYKCGEGKHPVEVVNGILKIDGKLATRTQISEYEDFSRKREKLKSELKGQSDKFLCH